MGQSGRFRESEQHKNPGGSNKHQGFGSGELIVSIGARNLADVSLRRASTHEWPAIADLLSAVQLPLDGAGDHLSRFWVVEREGDVIACAATEEHADAVLLRSVAVHPAVRGRGLAEHLCVTVLEESATEGFRRAYLLTTTADGFFPRFGFAPVTRADTPPSMRSSPEFKGACPDTAVVMGLTLRRPLPWVRRAGVEDVVAITHIYNQGIEDRIATLDESPHTEDERAAWLTDRQTRHPVIVAVVSGQVGGWASLNPFNVREAYRYVADLSVYVARDLRGKGVGTLLLAELVRRAKTLGYHKLALTSFPFNASGMALYTRMGFQVVGILHEQGQLDGRWVDTVMMEHLL